MKPIPARRAFCTISKLVRPLTIRIDAGGGQRPAATWWPTSLSTAL